MNENQTVKETVEKPIAPKSDIATVTATPSETTETVQDTPQPLQETQLATVQEAHLKPAEIKNGEIIFTQKHVDLIKSQIAPTASKEELELFFMMAKRTRLDPLLKQLYFIKYGSQVSYVTSIDSYRIIAHRTDSFAGVDLPIFDYDKAGKVTHASITVYKLVQGQRFGFSAKVKFAEYTTGKNQWASKPETMIAKVAEAHALRKAFPQDLSGIYTSDEMEQATQRADTPKVKMVEKAQLEMMLKTAQGKGKTQEQLVSYLQRRFNKKPNQLTYAQANAAITSLIALPDPEPIEEDFNTSGEEGDQVADDAAEALGAEPQGSIQ